MKLKSAYRELFMNKAVLKAQPLCGDEKLKAFLESEGYRNVTFLPDGVCALFDFLYTTGVVINCTMGGFEKRICYPRGTGLAEICLGFMTSIDSPPLPGYTALK